MVASPSPTAFSPGDLRKVTIAKKRALWSITLALSDDINPDSNHGRHCHPRPPPCLQRSISCHEREDRSRLPANCYYCVSKTNAINRDSKDSVEEAALCRGGVGRDEPAPRESLKRASVNVTDIIDLLHHRHGTNHAGTSIDAANSEGQDACKGCQTVLIGLLSFESLRYGGLAVSSLFLTDETGHVRLLCVPPPPSSWLGQVVCVSRWTLTEDTKQSAPANASELAILGLNDFSGNDLSVPRRPFVFCLEASEMWSLTMADRTMSTRDASTGQIAKRNVAGGGGVHGGWLCMRTPQKRMTASSAMRCGALALDTFVGRKGRGPVDVVARVASISPVICVKDASPFCMVELEEQDTSLFAHIDQDKRTGAGEDDLPSSADASAADAPRIKTTEIFRSPSEIAALFHGTADELRVDLARPPVARQHAALDREKAFDRELRTLAGKACPRRSTEEQGPDNSGEPRADLLDSASCDGKEEEGPRKADSAHDQLVAKLVLSGKRCLAWQPFLVPGRTYLFPGLGAFVLGGGGSGNKMYRAFGDAKKPPGAVSEGSTKPTVSHLEELCVQEDKPSTSGGQRGSGMDMEETVPRSHEGAKRVEHLPGYCGAATRVGDESRSHDCYTDGPRTGHLLRECTLSSPSGEREAPDWEEKADASVDGSATRTCTCVLTYQGKISGLAGQAGTYVLDGETGTGGICLYLQNLNCSSLGAGLRRGAVVKVHNVHPIYVGLRLVGLGACLRTSVQILSFSPLADKASYRVLAGGPSKYPLVVHAWRHAFKSLLDKKRPDAKPKGNAEAAVAAATDNSCSPRRGRPAHSLQGLPRETCADPSGLSERPPAGLRRVQGQSNTSSVKNTRPSSDQDRQAPHVQDVEGDTKRDSVRSTKASSNNADWASAACRWVFTDRSRSLTLPKRDVYAEFMDHPSGTCATVDPRARDCNCYKAGSCKKRRNEGGTLEEANSLDTATIGTNGRTVIQRADEGWHGDSHDAGDNGHAAANVASKMSPSMLRSPSPEALLQAASRPLAESLEVAIYDAVEAVTAVKRKATGLDGHPLGRPASSSAAAARGTASVFMIRTPFGVQSGRSDGILGWLSPAGRHNRSDLAGATVTSAPVMTGGDFKIEDGSASVPVLLARRSSVLGRQCLIFSTREEDKVSQSSVRQGRKRSRPSRGVDLGGHSTSSDERCAASVIGGQTSSDKTPAGTLGGTNDAGVGGVELPTNEFHDGEISGSQEPSLAFVSKFAVCTEVVMLASARTSGAKHPSASSKKGKGSHPSERRLAEAIRVIDGVEVLLRSYLVIAESDLMTLACQPVDGGPRETRPSSRRPQPQAPLEGKEQNVADTVKGSSATTMERSADGGGRMRPANGLKVNSRGREFPVHRPHATKRHAPCTSTLSVSESVVVRLAQRSGGAGEGQGIRIHARYERECISVRGLVVDLAFRLDAGRDRCKASAASSAGNASEGDDRARQSGSDCGTQVGRNVSSGYVFERLREANMQLCMTLAQAEDEICVYLPMRRAAWPMGIFPGYSFVQVEGVCRRLSGNGKSVYLAVSRAGGGTVEVLSLALPPPPPCVPISGRPTRTDEAKTYRQKIAARQSGSKRRCRDGEGGDYGQLLLFAPRPHVLPNDHVVADDDLRLEDVRRSLHSEQSDAFLGRGVIAARRGGDILFVNTYPIDAPRSLPLPPPPPPPPPLPQLPPNETSHEALGALCPSGAETACRDGVGIPHVQTDGGRSSNKSALSKRGKDPRIALPGCGTDGTWPPNFLCAGQAPQVQETPSAPPTIGDMFKRGVLVRAATHLSSLSVLGVRFVKASLWCQTCGPVGMNELAAGSCWARCDVTSAWEVRWESAATVDDGTGQALLLLDGEDVLALLRLTVRSRRDVEAAARQHGPVSFPGKGGMGDNLADGDAFAPHSYRDAARSMLAAAVLLVETSRGHLEASCVQVMKRNLFRRGRRGKSGARNSDSCGSAIVDVMGMGMDTLTLPKIMLQGSRLRSTDVREESYAIVSRLGH